MAQPKSHIPGAGGYEQTDLALKLAYERAMHQYNLQQQTIQSQFGVGNGPNGFGYNGNAGSLIGQQTGAEGLQIQQANTAIQNRGFNSSQGFGQGLEQPLRNQQGIADASLMSKYTNAAAGIKNAQLLALSNYNTGKIGALQKAAGVAEQNRNYTPVS